MVMFLYEMVQRRELMGEYVLILRLYEALSSCSLMYWTLYITLTFTIARESSSLSDGSDLCSNLFWRRSKADSVPSPLNVEIECMLHIQCVYKYMYMCVSDWMYEHVQTYVPCYEECSAVLITSHVWDEVFIVVHWHHTLPWARVPHLHVWCTMYMTRYTDM